MSEKHEVLEKFASEFPLATEAIWYFIYGAREGLALNNVFNEYYVKTGRGDELYTKASQLVMQYEHNWEDHLYDLETALRDLIGDDPNIF